MSFWVPGFFGSLAAAPLQPGWSLQTTYYHTSVSAGADVSRAREITIGRIPVNLNANLSATLDARADFGWALPIYAFATPVLGGQASVGVQGIYGRVSTSLAGTLAGTLTTPLGTIPFARSDSISDAVWGFGDVIPIATLRWNAGAHNHNDTCQRPLSLPEAVLICFRLQMQLLHKKSLICTKTLGSIGAMTSASQRSGLEFRFERGVSLGLKSFIARLDEFRTGVALWRLKLGFHKRSRLFVCDRRFAWHAPRIAVTTFMAHIIPG